MARAADSDPTWRANAQGGRAYLEFSRGAGAEARDEFVAEAEAYAAHDQVAAGRLMSLAMNYDVMRLNAPGMLPICARAAELACPGGLAIPSVLVDVMTLIGRRRRRPSPAPAPALPPLQVQLAV